jgi:hypothetical protein
LVLVNVLDPQIYSLYSLSFSLQAFFLIIYSKFKKPKCILFSWMFKIEYLWWKILYLIPMYSSKLIEFRPLPMCVPLENYSW